MNILITRPLIDTEDLMGKFFSLGHKIIHIPTLKISTANINPVDAKKYNAFIFTSANAIRNLKLMLELMDYFKVELYKCKTTYIRWPRYLAWQSKAVLNSSGNAMHM